MVSKRKAGKQRRDKFYQLAKETGYRSRAAFKLIQLNRKFSFLGKSRVCIDLCAAPGGWMQVAVQNMPVSSIVVGVDLHPIKPIQGCISLVGDITEEETAKALERELKTWKADLVLHDGSPNVGMNWLYDAHGQISLALSALKLATRFLRAGGCFVTKVFRSKDYHALLWVLHQLFKKVHSTKPAASRLESAEIYVVCQGYVAPDHLDPRFLNPTYVFEELELEPKNRINEVLHPEKRKPRSEGYQEGDYLQHRTITAREFIESQNAVEALAGLAEIIFDSDDEIAKHPTTTPEIIECCKDIKVLGRKDVRSLVTWWKKVRDDLLPKVKEEEDDTKSTSVDKKLTPDEEEDVELEDLSKKIDALNEEEQAEARRKRRKVNKERTKLHHKMNLKMVIKGDQGPTLEEEGIFELKQITNAQHLQEVTSQIPETLAESDVSDDDTPKPKLKFEPYSKEKSHLDKSGLFYTEEESDPEKSSEEESDSDWDEGLGIQVKDKQGNGTTIKSDTLEKSAESHPLFTDLDYRDKKEKRASKASMWFEKEAFRDLTNEADEDFEIDQLVEEYESQGGQIIGKKTDKKKSKQNSDSAYQSDEDGSGSDYDVERAVGKKTHKSEQKAANESEKYGFEIVPAEKKPKLKLDEEGLALGTLMVSSVKKKRDIIDSAWNKYAFNDTNLPDWFVEDEKVHMKPRAPVPDELVQEYKRKHAEINIRPIKKVIEAKARKKRRAMKKLEKAKKKLENIMENEDVSQREKIRQIRELYKKAKESKKEVTYVFAKKGGATKTVRRPKGVTGRYKVVDRRMKKDHIKQKKAFKKQGSRGNTTKTITKAGIIKMKRAQKFALARRANLVHTEQEN